LDWDAVVDQMVAFWVRHGEDVNRWRKVWQKATDDSLIVARVANFQALRQELETTFQQ
jgi:pyruvate kinase